MLDSKRPEYHVWRQMRQRCNNPNNKDFKHYGEKGVVVWWTWEHWFHVFIYDMGPRPSHAHWIDRINPEGNYEPRNCRWALPSEGLKRNR